MGYTTTPQEIEEMKQFLRDHPIDHRYDVPEDVIELDGDTPLDQITARFCYDILKELGELSE